MNMQELLVLRQTEVQAAMKSYEQAQAVLQLANINYRLTAIDCQPQLLDVFVKAEHLTAQERMVGAAYYVTTGAYPEIKPPPKARKRKKRTA